MECKGRQVHVDKVNVGKELSTETTISKLTKRIILSKVAGVFGPIGAAAAILVKAKIAMQELDGATRFRENVQRKRIGIFQEFNALNNVKFERCVKPSNVIEDPWLIIFCAASRLAFGTRAYVRWRSAKENTRCVLLLLNPEWHR